MFCMIVIGPPLCLVIRGLGSCPPIIDVAVRPTELAKYNPHHCASAAIPGMIFKPFQ